MRRLLLCLAIAMLVPAAAQALDVAQIEAPSGMEVWQVEEHSLPMIAISVSLPAGAAYDPAGREGLAALTAGMLNEGAGDMGAIAFQEALESRAIKFSASAGRDNLVVSVQTLTEHASEAFRLLGLALSRPRFDPDAIERVRAQLLASLKRDEEDPAAIAAKVWTAVYFGDHPYAHPENGTEAGLKAITRKDLQAFAAAHLVRGGAKLAVSGDVDAETLKTLVAGALGPLPEPAPAPIPPFLGGAGKLIKIVPLDVPQPSAVFGGPGLLRTDPDFIPAYVANYILGGGGFSSRLMEEVREKRGLTYGVSTSLGAYRAAGVVVGSVASQKERIAEAVGLIETEMGRIATEGVTDEELADAKTYLTGSFPLAFDSNVKIAGLLNAFQRDGLGRDYVNTRNDLVEAVTREQVNAAAKRVFAPEGLTVVIAGTPAGMPPAAVGASAQPGPKPKPGDKSTP